MAQRGDRRPPGGRGDERPDDDRASEPGDSGLSGWLRRAIGSRTREVWVMEPDGRMRRGMKDEE
jgi:hypothetical protein